MGSPRGMHDHTTPHTVPDEIDRERERMLREEADRARPDRRGPRGNQEPEREDVDRGREKLDRVLGW